MVISATCLSGIQHVGWCHMVAAAEVQGPGGVPVLILNLAQQVVVPLLGDLQKVHIVAACGSVSRSPDFDRKAACKSRQS